MSAPIRFVLLSLLLACSSATPRVHTTSALSPDEATARAAQLAPDLYAQSQRAAHDAQLASGSARADLELAAQLWLDAAIVEANRIELLRNRRESEARNEAAEMARAELDKKRVAVEEEIKLAEAARIARAEATRMLELASSDELARPGRARDQESRREEVASWLIGRAQLTLDAAKALGLLAPQAGPAENALRAAMLAAKGNARLEAAQNALEAAERAIGQARAASSHATAEERDALLEMAAERKLMPVRDARGIVFDVSAAFTAGTSKLTREGRAQLEHLSAIARAYPHGVIRIEALAPATAPAKARARRAARAQALLQPLLTATQSDRVQLAENPLPDADRLFVVFTAYGPSPTQGDQPKGTVLHNCIVSNLGGSPTSHNAIMQDRPLGPLSCRTVPLVPFRMGPFGLFASEGR